MTSAVETLKQNSRPGYWRALFLSLAFGLTLIGIFAPRGSWAAIAFVQETHIIATIGTISTTTPNFAQANSSGNLIVVGVLWGNASGDPGILSVTDTLGNVYAPALPAMRADSNGTTLAHYFQQIWYAKNVNAGTNAVTVKLTGSESPDFEIEAAEYSGLDTSSPLDQASSVTGTGNLLDSGSESIHFVNELIFGAGAGSSAATRGSFFILRGSMANNVNAEDRTVTSVGTFSATSSQSVSGDWIMQMATFKAAAPQGVQASSRSDTLSDSRPSATSSHTVVFTVNNAVRGSSVSGSSTITLTLDPAFTIPVGMDCGDIDAATSVQFNFNYPGCAATATAWGFSATGSVITLVPPSGTGVYVPTSTQVTINIGSNATVGQQGAHWITNPSSADVYTISVGGTFNGSGNILVAINSGLTVQATVAESLALTVSSVKAVNCTADDGATVSAADTSPTTVNFGTLTLNAFSQSCQDLVVSTNASAGYSLAVQESHAMMTANGQFTIPDTTCDASNCTVATATTWVTPTKNGFGHTCFNQSGSDCIADYANGTKFKPLNSPTGVTPGKIAFVQNDYVSGSGVGSLNKAFPSNNTAGNLIIVPTAWNDPSASLTAKVSDTQGNTYATAVGPIINQTVSSPIYEQIWYAKNIKGGANTVTVTYSSAPSFGANVYIQEYSGLDAVSPFDVGASATGTSANAASATSSTRAPNELIFGHIAASGGGTSSPGPGFTQRFVIGGISEITEDKIVAAAGSYQTTFTQSGNDEWIASMATFRASSSPVVLMSNIGPATSTGRIKYRVSAGNAQPAGVYTTIITYTLTPTY